MRRQRTYSKMKRVEIVVETSRVQALIGLIEAHATGYTLIPGATGVGEHGLRERDITVLVTVVTAEHLDAIVEAIVPTLSERANIVLITDVAVLRPDHFMPEVRAAVKRTNVNA